MSFYDCLTKDLALPFSKHFSFCCGNFSYVVASFVNLKKKLTSAWLK